MIDVDAYTRGFTAGIEAGRAAADQLAAQLEAANQRANRGWEAATAARADVAEQQYLAHVAREALASALANQEARA